MRKHNNVISTHHHHDKSEVENFTLIRGICPRKNEIQGTQSCGMPHLATMTLYLTPHSEITCSTLTV
jgi:hypothetical protein